MARREHGQRVGADLVRGVAIGRDAIRADEHDVDLARAHQGPRGDTANKVGTYPLAVLAARHGIPLYVCAPLSSVDLKTTDGDAIPIEERAAEEVLEFRGIRIAPVGTAARNPAFDVTPAELITGVVTEEGLLTPPFEPAFRAAEERARERWAATLRPGTEPV